MALKEKDLTYNPGKIVCDKPIFSAHHPLIPRRYVPLWQLDMKNRKNISRNSVLAYNEVWKGHVSYFLDGRERLAATNHRLHKDVLQYSRNLHPNSSHFSRYNSSIINMVI